jgi:plastocyanin
MKKLAVLLALALVSTSLVACGDDDNGTTTTDTGGEATNGAAAGGGGGEGGAGGGSTISIEADPSGALAFTTDSLTAKAGGATLEFTNESPVGHDADIEDEGGKVIADTEVISEGGDSAAIKDLKPGKYTFFCSVPGHRQGGMEGTLTVE